MREFGRPGKVAIILAHALAGWAFCAALMGIGQGLFSIETALIVHAIGAPVGFAALSALYFTTFAFTSPLQTATIFLATVVVIDLCLVAPVFVGSFEMFASPLGTWLPFALIFAVTYGTGALVAKRRSRGHDDAG